MPFRHLLSVNNLLSLFGKPQITFMFVITGGQNRRVFGPICFNNADRYLLPIQFLDLQLMNQGL